MNELPLSGIRILDFSWVIAGPTAARHLAMMGAEVIKVGSARRPDPSTNNPAFQVYNQSKYYCSLNVSKPEGVEIAKKLVAKADVFLENFASGVIERMGLGYDSLKEVKPDIIMVSSSGTGHSGPDKDYVAYGSLLQHYTGWNSISGSPGSEPIKGGLWADPWVGMELAMVTVAALNHRLLTGQGQYIDFSMAEALSASISEALLDYQMNGRIPDPIGNRDAQGAPHGLYRCAGEDRWAAIAVFTDEEWLALCSAIGRTDLASDPKFATADRRRNHQDELDVHLTDWTSTRRDYEVMRALQDAGVPSGPSLSIFDTYNDPQIQNGGYLRQLTTSDGAERRLPTLPWRFSDGTEPHVTAAPVLGQHNDYVYRELLEMPPDEIEWLINEQIIY